KVVDFTADTAKARISARLIYEHKQSQSAQYEISGRFATLTGAAGGLYKGLVFGQLGAIQAALKTPVAGFAIDPAASAITNFSQTDESLGYEVLLFGLQLTGAALLSSNAQVVLTGDGAVRIAAQGSYTVSQKALGASRSLGFSTSYAFASAKRDGAAGRPVIKLGLAAARADSDLTLGEVTGFLDRLVQNRLIADARRTRAAQIYNGWAATRGTSTKLPGSIALELNFNASDVAALLRAGSALADPPDGAAPAIDLFARAVSAMTCTGEWSASDRHDQLGDLTTVSEFARIQQQHPSEAAFLYQICLEQRLNTVLGLGVARGGGSRPTSYALPRLLELPDKAQAGFAFTRLIGGLARLYAASVPADGAQAAQLFSALERQIADQAGWWLKLGGTVFLACGKRLQPRTVALFLALASLARGVSPDAPGASFDDMFTLSLTRENQSATLVV
ncbi:MAG TPA: hypothetical protein VN222_10395, partial [Novosphingobium sp.]|nr:hypothetical protein [Novosphingobium sp.]